MEDNFSDLINDTEMTNLNIVQVDLKHLEYERALEILSQNILILLEQCFEDFPKINNDKIQKCMNETKKFLSFHEIYEENELITYIGQGLQQVIQDYA